MLVCDVCFWFLFILWRNQFSLFNEQYFSVSSEIFIFILKILYLSEFVGHWIHKNDYFVSLLNGESFLVFLAYKFKPLTNFMYIFCVYIYYLIVVYVISVYISWLNGKQSVLPELPLVLHLLCQYATQL